MSSPPIVILPSLEEAQQDLASLSRVSHRLALVEGTARLEQVLEKLLPRLLMRVGQNHTQKQQSSNDELSSVLSKIHDKLVEMLGHAMKRVRDDPACKIPCSSILDLLLQFEEQEQGGIGTGTSIPLVKTNVDALTLNLSLAFLTLGVPRCGAQECQDLLAGLWVLHGHFAHLPASRLVQSPATKIQWHQITHLLLRSMDRIILEQIHGNGGGNRQEPNSKRLKPSEVTAKTSTTSTNEKSADSSTNQNSTADSNFSRARKVLLQDDHAAAALFDLWMDVLLYQTTPAQSNVPPPGLSEAGHSRLKSGASTTARDWAAEMAPRPALMACKSRILQALAPSRQYQWLWDPSHVKNQTRTLTLLILATGDPMPEVAEQARLYLKQQMEASAHIPDPVGLVEALLMACVGESNAQLILSRPSTTAKGESSTNNTLGIFRTDSSHGNDNTSTLQQQSLLALKRRMISESCYASIVEQIAKILQDTPHIFSNDRTSIPRIGALALWACQRTLSQLHTSSGMTLLQAKPYLAAGQLLQALVIRWTNFTWKEEEDADASTGVRKLLAEALQLACHALTTFVTSRGQTKNMTTSSSSSSRTSEGNQSLRDGMYGVISILARSKTSLPENQMSWLFCKGQAAAEEEEETTSTETATLLFRCVAVEEDILQPRAVAALDALLGAYCRLILPKMTKHMKDSSTGTDESTPSVDNPWASSNSTENMSNPWAQPPTRTTVAMEVSETSGEDTSKNNVALVKSIVPLLWNAAQSQQQKARVAASSWSSELLSKMDSIAAAHLLCFLAGDTPSTAATLARQTLTGDEDSFCLVCDFASLVQTLFPEGARSSSSRQRQRPTFWDFTLTGRAMTVEYLMRCLLRDIYGEDEDGAVQTLVSAISTCIVEASHQAHRDYLKLLEECASALSTCLSSSSLARNLMSESSTKLTPDQLRELSLSANSSKARRLLSQAWCSLYEDASVWDSESTLLAHVEEAFRTCQQIFEENGPASLAKKHGAAFLAGAAIQVYRCHSFLQSADPLSKFIPVTLDHIHKELMSNEDIIGNACADALSIAFAYDKPDAPVLQGVFTSGMAAIVSNLSQAIRKYGDGESLDVPRAMKLVQCAGTCLASTTRTDDSLSSTGIQVESNLLVEARMSCVDSLFQLLGSTSFKKEEEIALLVGEALVEYAGSYNQYDVIWSSSEQEKWPEDNDDTFARALPPHQQILYKLLRRARLENNPQRRTASGPALFAVVASAAKQLNNDVEFRGRPLVQEISNRLEDIQECFLSLLLDPKSKHLTRESCCLGLAACRTIARISMAQGASDEMMHRLLRAFGQTTNHGGSAMQETTEQAAERRRQEGIFSRGNDPLDVDMGTEVGGASGIGEASLGAYREMAGAAVSLGRPDILYALLMLSVSHPVWNSENRDYGPSALLGQHSFLGTRGNAAEMRTALKSHLGKLIPRIMRGCYSPNKETRDQMQRLWDGLTGGGAEARSAISEHLLVTIDVLIEESTSSLWRTRLGACGALSQVIVGRSWQELGGGAAVLYDDDVVIKTSTENTTAGVRLLRIWRVAMRALDDVRINVREAGETLARGVRSLTLRLVDPNTLKDAKVSDTDVTELKKDARAAAATILRWLIKHGLEQQCAEAAGVCLSCLVGVVDVANPAILQPLIPDLLRSLLLSMSSLEPAAFSYLQVRAAGESSSTENYDSLERLRLQVVQSGPIASAVTKILDMMPSMNISVQKAVVPQLDSAIRLSAGLTTRTAAADCVSTLCSTCPNAFKNDTRLATNPTVSLLRALHSASEYEKGQAARDKYAHACGNLAALSPGWSVRSLALRAAEKYNRATGSNDNPNARKAAAMILRAIAVRASDQFQDGGTSNIWNRRILPIAFVGMQDKDVNVAKLFADVWEEGGSAANLGSAENSFGTLLEEKILWFLVKECVKALNDVAWYRRVIGANSLKELANREILSPPPRRLGDGDSNDDRHNQRTDPRWQYRSKSSSLALISLVKTISDTRLWSGKQSVVEACCMVAAKWCCTASTSEDMQLGSGSFNSDPLCFGVAPAIDDLFLNDGRFRQETEDDLLEEGAQTPVLSMDETSGKPDGDTIDFDGNNDVDQEEELKVEAMTGPEMLQKDDGEEGTGVPTFSGICRMLLSQAFLPRRSMLSVKTEEVLPYRSSVLQSVARLLAAIDGSPNCITQKKLIIPFISKDLVPIFLQEKEAAEGNKESPLVKSRALDCFAACLWDGFGTDSSEDELLNVLHLAQSFKSLLFPEHPWSVRTSALQACSRLVAKSASFYLRDHVTISTAFECAEMGTKDNKYWKVRHASLEVLESLVSRCGQNHQQGTFRNSAKSEEQQLVLEAILPQKESISRLAKQSLKDSEPKVTALASQILGSLAWWP